MITEKEIKDYFRTYNETTRDAVFDFLNQKGMIKKTALEEAREFYKSIEKFYDIEELSTDLKKMKEKYEKAIAELGGNNENTKTN